MSAPGSLLALGAGCPAAGCGVVIVRWVGSWPGWLGPALVSAWLLGLTVSARFLYGQPAVPGEDAWSRGEVLLAGAWWPVWLPLIAGWRCVRALAAATARVIVGERKSTESIR